jgi:hypothetical protein
MAIFSTSFSKGSRLIFFHVIFLLILFIVFKMFFIKYSNVHLSALLSFDSSWYNSIKEYGYVFKIDVQSNSGFYPAFPFLWKITNLTPLGISIFNAVIFLLSFFLLAKYFDFNFKEYMLGLSVPSFMFCFIPYTEALFSLFAVIFLIGLSKKKYLLQFIGIFFCCLIRPATIIFVPTIIFTELLSSERSKIKSARILFLIFSSILSMAIVAYIQWLETGIWFAHAKAQIINWNHGFHIPKFPLTTWIGPKTIWLDGTAFWLGLITIVMLVFNMITRRKITESDKPFFFSLAYLAGVTLFVLFFNGYNDNGRTTLLSLNRYFFATPFFLIAFQKFMRLSPLRPKSYLAIILSLIFVWLLFGAYTSIDWFDRAKTVTYFSILTVIITIFVLFLNHGWFIKRHAWIIIYITNSFLFTYLLLRFLSSEWVG